jgi:hypothetical protein
MEDTVGACYLRVCEGKIRCYQRSEIVNGVSERPLQLLYPMELYVSKNTDKKVMKQLNREAEEFQQRKERAAKTNAKNRLEQLAKNVQDDEL